MFKINGNPFFHHSSSHTLEGREGCTLLALLGLTARLAPGCAAMELLALNGCCHCARPTPNGLPPQKSSKGAGAAPGDCPGRLGRKNAGEKEAPRELRPLPGSSPRGVGLHDTRSLPSKALAAGERLPSSLHRRCCDAPCRYCCCCDAPCRYCCCCDAPCRYCCCCCRRDPLVPMPLPRRLLLPPRATLPLPLPGYAAAIGEKGESCSSCCC